MPKRGLDKWPRDEAQSTLKRRHPTGRVDPNHKSEECWTQGKGRKSSQEEEYFPEMKRRTPRLNRQDSEQDPSLGAAPCFLSLS